VVVVGRKALKLRSPCFSATVPTSSSTRAFRRGQIFLTFGFAGPRLAEADLWGNSGGRAFCQDRMAWRDSTRCEVWCLGLILASPWTTGESRCKRADGRDGLIGATVGTFGRRFHLNKRPAFILFFLQHTFSFCRVLAVAKMFELCMITPSQIPHDTRSQLRTHVRTISHDVDPHS